MNGHLQLAAEAVGHKGIVRLADKQKIRVTLPDNIRQGLRDRCLKDLSNGGRGIGNQLEAWLINPLGRALFDSNVPEGSTATIATLDMIDGIPTVNLVS